MAKLKTRKIIVLLMLVLAPLIASTQHLLNFQGVINDNQGEPVTDGTYEVTFSIYETQAAETVFWEETQSVVTENGVFNCLLGSVTSLGELPQDEAFIEVHIGTEMLMPRVKIVNTAYSIQSKEASNAKLLGGLPPEMYFGRSYQGVLYVKPSCNMRLYIHPKRENPTVTAYFYGEPLDAPAVQHAHGNHHHPLIVRINNHNYDTFQGSYSGYTVNYPGGGSSNPVSVQNTSIGSGDTPIPQTSIPSSVHIWIDGIDRTTELGGPFGTTPGVSWRSDELDLSEWVTTQEEHFVEIKEEGGTGGRLLYNIYVE